jgi:ABC-type lipoprotein export system ATPase subunit/bifunctional DNA-binding transcriptional regulator/antitoxin component of YhaV-PrlF toxin-antitoxin module
MDNGKPFIVCDNLVKIYRVAEHDVVALQGLDMVVEPGELMGVVGVSGSGKSTLMNVLGGLDRPTAGRVWADGQDLLKLSNQVLDQYRLSTVGFVWQQASRNLIPYLSAIKNVEMPMILAGNMGKRRRAEELLELVGLSDRKHHKLSEMSGGEQQRVAIAVALVNRPKLLLADEPTGEVDDANSKMIYQIFKDLNTELKLTTIIVSHDPGLARHVDRVIAIRDGKIATETLRSAANGDKTPDRDQSESEIEEEHVFMELTVLDSAGRLQIPKEYREHFEIRRRVQLELLDDGILIRPVVTDMDKSADAEAIVTELVETRKGTRIQQIADRLKNTLSKSRFGRKP